MIPRPLVPLQVLALLLLAGLAPSALAGSKLLPVLNHPIADLSSIVSAPVALNLNDSFGTEPIDDQVVRFTSWFDDGGVPVVMDFALFSNRTPGTRTNFLNYVSDGDYTNSFIHRSVPGFVIQGGGFRVNGDVEAVPTDPPITNEFGVSNTLATISMAKSVGANSATSQWFVSLGANSDNLDNQNGGFTVFGRVTKNTFSNAQLFGNPAVFPVNAYAQPFNELPLLYPFNPAEPLNYIIKFPSVTLVPLPAGQAGDVVTLIYSVVSNSNPALATVAVQGPATLNLTPQPGKTGAATITIRATDSVGNTVDDTFRFTVNATDTYTSWASRTTFPGGQSGITQNPDGDTLTNLQEYALFGNPAVSSQTQVPLAGKTGTAPQFLTLAFPVRKFTTGLSYVVEANSQLTGSWTPVWSSGAGFGHPQVVSAVDQADRTLVTVKDTAAMSGQAHRFLRLKLIQN